MDVATTAILSVYGASILGILGFYLRRFENRLDSLEATMIRGFETVDRRFEAVDRRFEAVDRRFEAVDKRFDRIDDKFERLNDKQGNHGERISALEVRNLD